VYLREHPAATGRRLLEEGDVRAPEIGFLTPAEQTPRDGPPGLDGQIAQPHMVVAQALGVSARALAGQLEHARVHVAHHADEPAHLVPRGQAAGDGTSVRGLVARRARGGEADRAGANRIAQLALHRAQIVLAGFLLERALAHDVGAQRGVADVSGVVDALGEAFDAVEELRERGPGPVDARVHRFGGDVFGALKIAHDQVALRLAARREREAAVAHHDRGDSVPAGAGAHGIPEDLGVHVRVTVDKARRDDLPIGVDHLTGGLADPPDGRDPAVTNRDVGPIAGQSGSVDHRAVLDDQVVRHRVLLPSTRPGTAGPRSRWLVPTRGRRS
jgi:hypothetical protein